MKKGWFVYSGYFWSESTHFLLDKFTAAFEKLGCKLELLKSNELGFYIDSDGNIKNLGNLAKPDFVVFWDKDLPLAKMLDKWGVRLFNSWRAIEICDSKIDTHIALAENGIAMPKTVVAPLVFRTCTEKDTVFLDRLTKILSFPIVVKEASGSFGEQVYLANDLDELKKIRQRLLYTPHLYQEFVESSKGHDVRVIVLEGKVIAAMMRKNETDFRSNIELGGHVEQYVLPKAFCDAAEYAAKALGLDFCGVDLLIGKDGQPLLCEVNSNPYFRGIMQSTGVNVAELYAEYILRQLKNATD